MSDSSVSPGTLEEVAHQVFLHNCLHLFAVTLLFYDHFITFDLEVEYLWRRPKTQSAYWFFLNRYVGFFGNVAVTALSQSNLSFDSCQRYNWFRQLFLVFNQVLICILLTLRIFALYNRSRRILAYMFGSGVVLVGVACWTLFGQKHIPQQHFKSDGCHVGLARISAIHLASAWEALFVYDSIIFGLTMFKTWKNRNEFVISLPKNSIVYYVFRDGAVYFAVMALANLSNILTFYFCGPYMSGGLSTFASSISITMMSRLMLNLHQSADLGIYSVTRSRTDFSTTNVQCVPPSPGVELDTIMTGDMYHSTIRPC